jgi:hypothetical protein
MLTMTSLAAQNQFGTLIDASCVHVVPSRLIRDALSQLQCSAKSVE